MRHGGEQNKGAHVRGRFDQIGGEHHRLAGGSGQFFDGKRSVPCIGGNAGADRGCAKVHLPKQRGGLLQAVDILLHSRMKRIEFLPECHRHRVLQLGAADLEHIGEFDRLGLERIG